VRVCRCDACRTPSPRQGKSRFTQNLGMAMGPLIFSSILGDGSNPNMANYMLNICGAVSLCAVRRHPPREPSIWAAIASELGREAGGDVVAAAVQPVAHHAGLCCLQALLYSPHLATFPRKIKEGAELTESQIEQYSQLSLEEWQELPMEAQASAVIAATVSALSMLCGRWSLRLRASGVHA
jgi:hypothetical protein